MWGEVFESCFEMMFDRMGRESRELLLIYNLAKLREGEKESWIQIIYGFTRASENDLENGNNISRIDLHSILTICPSSHYSQRILNLCHPVFSGSGGSGFAFATSINRQIGIVSKATILVPFPHLYPKYKARIRGILK